MMEHHRCSYHEGRPPECPLDCKRLAIALSDGVLGKVAYFQTVQNLEMV